MPEGAHELIPLDPAKFQNPAVTAKGEIRASVALSALKTLWFNTGSLCNITCENCYMQSSPSNDDLIYLTDSEVRRYLDEISATAMGTPEIGFTGGEPFMNSDLGAMLDDVLGRGLSALVLTNAMKPLWQKRQNLLDLKARHGQQRLKFRVSIDHHSVEGHEKERGVGTWAPMEAGVKWLIENGFSVDIAGRTLYQDGEYTSRQGYQHLCDAWNLNLDAFDPARLVLFPEMDETRDVPEITTQCWGVLGVRPDAMMCATSRMIVHRKGDPSARIVPCTLLPFETQFDMGEHVRDALGTVALNHPHCAKFCVLGGASCSST